MTDWQAIRNDRDAGMSFRVLSAKYGVPLGTLAYNLKKEPSSNVPRTNLERVQAVERIEQQRPVQPSLPDTPTDLIELVKRLIDQLSRIAKDELDLKEHTLLSQSLSQYYKILVAPPAQEQQPGQFDLSILNEEELEQVQRIFAQAESRMNITPIRNAS